jgi:hypothetical protein
MTSEKHPITESDLQTALERLRRAGGLRARPASQRGSAGTSARRRAGYRPSGELLARLEFIP